LLRPNRESDGYIVILMMRLWSIEFGQLIAHSNLNELDKSMQKLFELFSNSFIF